MLDPVGVIVNGREYAVNPFNPGQAFDYLHAMVVARGTGRGVSGLGRAALMQCVTPDGRRLENADVFEKWFAEHPADMLELETRAMDALCAPWEGKTEEAASTTSAAE